ncbi:DUF6046 domain-containing protein [Bacteroides sp.]|uniref:DUF6046 domain-containing protein n=1 Tax=Bacteroides sp. TaxID=29523 RepID=UPI0025C07E5E|nr:DUF6046 domain-containing protein [Bacteroides sp.]
MLTNELKGLAKATLLSGGVISHGSVSGYISDSARRALGLGLAHFQDGAVHLFSKDSKILKRALIQRTHQLAYGALRSYPRFIKYWERVERDKYLQTKSQSSIANKTGQYFQLISEQKAVAKQKGYADTIVGNIVQDYLELEISKEGTYYDNKTKKVESNSQYGLVTFVDLQPLIQVNSKNNIVMTTVQGRDYTRKEYISGGDLEININGKITSKYPDVYPDAEVSKFLKIMQYKGVLNCENTILRQFNITQLIILSYNVPAPEYRNIQPYTISCVAVEPSEAIEVKIRDQEVVDTAIKHTNKWIKLVKLGTEVIDPASLLKISRLWI